MHKLDPEPPSESPFPGSNPRLEIAKLESMFMQAPTAMALWRGEDLVFEKINPAYQKIFPGRTLLGLPFEIAVPEMRSQPFPAMIRQVLRTGEPIIGTEFPAMIRRSPDGLLEERFYDFTYVRICGAEGEPYGVYDHAIDVTDRVQAKRTAARLTDDLRTARDHAEAANLAKSTFLANMSHEIRTPLGAIMGFSELAVQKDLSRQDLDNYLAIINRNSKQVLRIIDDILDLSKVEAGRLSIEKVDFSLIEFLSDFSAVMKFRARENGINYFTTVGSALPQRVISDPTRLRQILINSVGNAIKFTTKGHVRLHVTADQGVLRFLVADTGRGISPEQAENLFQPFAQADSSTTRKFGGTGLGLVLTRHLCELMGGSYVLEESSLGQGSSFAASVRVAPSPGSDVVPPQEIHFESVVNLPKPLEPDQLKNLNVLLVEDSLDNQLLLKIFLTQQGARFQIAADGSEGVRKAREGDFDLVLMDIQMPKMDGHEAVRTLRAQGYAKPIIALSAHAMREEMEKAAQSGFTGYVSKPIHKPELIATILELTER
ncbi:MAG: response regulator [Bdellovibrionaceae bacterium]|nr:response regulator [Pseudobdellovibrionaceae bacterium]